MTQKNRQSQHFGADVKFDDAVSISSVNAGSTLSVLQNEHDGRIILLNAAAGSVCDLPAATGSGARYAFLVSVEPTSNSHIVRVAAGTDDEFIGQLILVDVDTSDGLSAQAAQAADDFDTITLNAGTTGGEVGDFLEVVDVASGVWAVRGQLKHTGDVGAPMSDGSISAS